MNADALRIALVGNPNCGKTALFNLLTGSRQKVANYAGVTVERKEGWFTSAAGRRVRVLDLPGAYSLAAASPDEAVTRAACLGLLPGEAPPDLIVAVVDATNLRLHLRFVLELRALARPMVVALNMMDEARQRGIAIDVAALQAALGVRVVETVAVKRGGAAALVAALDVSVVAAGDTALDAALDTSVRPEPVEGRATGLRQARPERVPVPSASPLPDLHREVHRLLSIAVRMPRRTAERDDRIDRVVLHPVAGLALLGAILFLMFQAVFAWAQPLMDAIQAGFDALGGALQALLPPGPLEGLLVDGLVAGAGSVIVFLPQILILFFFILVLEESGYLPRAAFLLDRFMVGAGLTGRSFIPLLSSFACAVPGIMATRTIPDPRDRLATILVAPLMTCSARLPVYALLIGAFIPQRSVAGLFNLQGVVLFALYVAGIASAMGVAWAMKRWRRGRDAGNEHALLLELPSYRLPQLRSLAFGLAERMKIFINRVGTIILSLTVLLWALSSWPAPPPGALGPAIDYSLAGRLGHGLQHVFAPVGFNWQICIALIPGLAAREVAVASLATVYAISATKDAAAEQLLPVIAAQWSLATALALLAWYVFAPQCLSTLAVIRRETNSWKTVALAAGYLFALAYVAAFVTYRVALLFS